MSESTSGNITVSSGCCPACPIHGKPPCPSCGQRGAHYCPGPKGPSKPYGPYTQPLPYRPWWQPASTGPVYNQCGGSADRVDPSIHRHW